MVQGTDIGQEPTGGFLNDSGIGQIIEDSLSRWEGMGSREEGQKGTQGWLLCILLYSLCAELSIQCMLLMLGLTQCLHCISLHS